MAGAAFFTTGTEPSTPSSGQVVLYSLTADKNMYYKDDTGKIYGPVANANREGAAVASAATTNVWVNDGSYKHITGTTSITSFGTAPQAGAQVTVEFDDVCLLTEGSDLVLNNGGLDVSTEAGDIALIYADSTTEMHVYVIRRSGAAVSGGGGGGGGGGGIYPITASVGSNALTATLNITSLDFRSATLSSGTVNTRAVNSPISVVVSSGSTLGTTSGVAARLAILAIDNAGTVEAAIVNLAGGVNLDETTLISTTAEGGAGAADSISTIYSTTGRSNVPFRVVGFIDITEATAGTWATAPSTIQGTGGQALAALSSIGYGQRWQSVTRTSSTTYYNTTGKPIMLSIIVNPSSSAYLTINGASISGTLSCPAGTRIASTFILQPGNSYVITVPTGTIGTFELR